MAKGGWVQKKSYNNDSDPEALGKERGKRTRRVSSFHYAVTSRGGRRKLEPNINKTARPVAIALVGKVMKREDR